MRDEIGKKLEHLNRSFTQSVKPIAKFRKVSQLSNTTFANMQKQFDKAGFTLGTSGRITSNVTGRFVKFNKAATIAGVGMSRFRFELLSVMFGAMALSGAIEGLISPTLENFGVFDMFGAMMEDLFTPIMEPISDILFGIMDAFMSLPQPVKDFIGAAILLTGVIAGLLAMFTIISLAGGGLAMALAPLGLTISGIAGPILLIIGLGALLLAAWTGNWFGIRDIVSNVIGIIGNVIKTFLDFFKAIWEGRWSDALSIATDFGTRVLNFIRNFVGNIINFFGDMVGKAFQWGADLLGKFLDGLKSVAGQIADFFINLIPEPFRSALKSFGAAIFGEHKGFIGGARNYMTKEGGLYEAAGRSGGSSVIIENPIINITTVLDKTNVDSVVFEVIQKLGTRLIRVG